jgi:gamma-glutamylaminecyclotransferase
MLIFVYGTLKRGHSNHGYLRGQTFIGLAITEPRYRLHDLGGFPGMVLVASHGTSIQGEVWEIDEACLNQLDELEGTEIGEYLREPISLLPPFQDQRVQGYRYLMDVSAAPDLGACW